MLKETTIDLLCNKNKLEESVIDLNPDIIEQLYKYASKKPIKKEKEDKKDNKNKEQKIEIEDKKVKEDSISEKIKILVNDVIKYSSTNDKLISKQWVQYFTKPRIEYKEVQQTSESKNFVYGGIDASGTFIPLLQTYYIMDAKKISKDMEKTPISITYKDIKEKIRVAFMNGNDSNNYTDPDLAERYKMWSLFSFNFTFSVLYYHNFST